MPLSLDEAWNSVSSIVFTLAELILAQAPSFVVIALPLLFEAPLKAVFWEYTSKRSRSILAFSTYPDCLISYTRNKKRIISDRSLPKTTPKAAAKSLISTFDGKSLANPIHKASKSCAGAANLPRTILLKAGKSIVLPASFPPSPGSPPAVYRIAELPIVDSLSRETAGAQDNPAFQGSPDDFNQLSEKISTKRQQ